MRLKVLAVVALVAGTLACNRIETRSEIGDAERVAQGPNLVLVTIDTLRADRVGAYGHAAAGTPTLDRWAHEGALFETAIASTPLTLPSHATMMTGLAPPAHGVRNNGFFRLGDDATTLAEHLQASGWQTAAVVGAIVLAPHYGIDQGFETFDAEMDGGRSSGGGFPERKADRVTERALSWLGTRDPDRPFFLWVHYYDPHAVYAPPERYRERFDDPYDGEIAFVDDQLQRIEAALRFSGDLDRTVISVTSDHGDSLGEHGEATHGYAVYDATQHVPWIVRGPKVPPAQRLAGVVSGADLAPTLVGLMGLPAMPAVQGRDLSGWLAGGAAPEPRPAYAETLATSLEHGWAPLHAIRTEEQLYVRAPRSELFDVDGDPSQLTNLIGTAQGRDAHAGAVARHEASIDAELAQEVEAARLRPDASMRAELEALGYLVPEQAAEASAVDPKDMIRFIAPLQEAHALFRAGDLAASGALAQRLLAEMPDSADLLALLGRVRLAQSEFVDAHALARRAVSLNPRSAYHQVLLGNTAVRLGKLDDAIAAYQAAVDTDPNYAAGHAGLMWRAKQDAPLAEVQEHARRASGNDPGDGSAFLAVADQWDALGHYDLALEAYEEALERAPQDAQAHLGLAVELIRFGDPSAADRHLSRAGDALRPASARMRLAIAYAGQQRFAPAESLLRGILGESPDDAAARGVLARVLEDQGRSEEAARLRAGGAS